MFLSNFSRSTLLLVVLLFAGSLQAKDITAPEITAQGFDISVAQEGVVGAFGEIRVRFEAPERISELYVRERSYDVDLAKTVETSHFPLFGLKTQVRQLRDVTLNFQNYINEKIDSAGDYRIELRVTDREGNSVSGNLLIRVVNVVTASEQADNKPVEKSAFRFERVGASAVNGAEDFGITWKTIESNQVLIEISKQDKGASRLVEMTLEDYEEVMTEEQLEGKIAQGNDMAVLHLSTSNNKATNSVFGVVNQGVNYMLKVTDSDSSTSPQGTKVTLIGEFKHL